MSTQSTIPERYRRLLSASRHRFGAEDWIERMARYQRDPRAFAHNVLGSNWWSAQEDVGRALVQYRRVAVRSGNGVGKTYLAADLALWFLFTHHPAVVLTSAPTSRQVRHVLWREIRRRFQTARKRLPGQLYHTRIDLGGGSFALGLATDSASGGVRFQGFHADNLLIILDEASGIPDDIWDAAEGVAVGGNNKILAIGNPLMASGRFYQLFKGLKGWHKLTISALDHPNVVGRGRPIPGCVTEAFIDEKVQDWCEPANDMTDDGRRTTETTGPESVTRHPSSVDLARWKGISYRPNDLFRARILGEFPRSADTALIPLDWIEAAVGRQLPDTGARRLAADVARFGDDWTIIGLRQGPILLDLWPIKGADTKQVADKIEELAYAEHPSTIAVDVIGIGAGVVDNLNHRGIEGLEPINVSHAAFDPERFANRRAELYWGLRERFHQGDISLPDAGATIGNLKSEIGNLVEELAAIRYKINPRGQIQIESKEDMKRRLRRSPDRADMLALLFDNSSDALALLPERRRGPTERELLIAEMSRW